MKRLHVKLIKKMRGTGRGNELRKTHYYLGKDSKLITYNKNIHNYN